MRIARWSAGQNVRIGASLVAVDAPTSIHGYLEP